MYLAIRVDVGIAGGDTNGFEVFVVDSKSTTANAKMAILPPDGLDTILGVFLETVLCLAL